MGEKLRSLLQVTIAILLVLLVLGTAVAAAEGLPATSPGTILVLPGVHLNSGTFQSESPLSQGPGEGHTGMSPQERLKHPPMSDPPTQVELGHSEYWMSCMVCHGDRGQGLTEEWRSVLDPADMNCWQSKCHAPNHPPEGFQIPRSSPMVIGQGALTGYETAADLFEVISVDMPWAFPGLFDEETYWNLTAFLADANNVDLGTEPLGPDNAEEILIMPDLVQTHQTDLHVERILAGVVTGLLLGAALLYGFIRAL
jgi:mono/diheme cytochrome c family protein